MAVITKQEFASAAMSYATANVQTFPGEGGGIQWGFNTDFGIGDGDGVTYQSEKLAMKAAEIHVKNDQQIWSAAVNDAREWMKYNGHTMA